MKIKLAFLLVALCAAPALSATQTPLAPVRVLRLTSARNETQYHYFGTVQGSQRVDLSFRVSGPLIEFPIEMGTYVKKGDLIGRIDPRDFKTQVSEAQSQLSEANAKYTQAQNDFKRYEELYKKKVVSESQYDRYKTSFDVANSAVKTAEANLTAAQHALEDTELRAPFNGVIVARMAENFQNVQAKQSVVSLQNLESLEIVFSIPEEDIANIGVRNTSTKESLDTNKISIAFDVTLDALPGQTFEASFKEIGAQSDSRTRTYPVTITMQQPETARVLPGMAVSVTTRLSGMEDDAKDQKFYVPMSAVTGDMTQDIWVWRCSEERDHEKISETPGDFSGERIQVSGNLNPGDLIVIAGARGLVEGQKVAIVD